MTKDTPTPTAQGAMAMTEEQLTAIYEQSRRCGPMGEDLRQFSDDVVKELAAEAIRLRAQARACEEGWRCFHCGEAFIDKEAARDHFGETEYEQAICLEAIEAGGLIPLYRAACKEIARYREEDTDLHRAFYSLGVKHAAELRAEEEKGYARGLADGRALTPQPAREAERVREILGFGTARDAWLNLLGASEDLSNSNGNDEITRRTIARVLAQLAEVRRALTPHAPTEGGKT